MRKFLQKRHETSSGKTLSEEERALTFKVADDVWRRIVRSGGMNLFTEEVLGFDNVPYQKEWYSVMDNRKLVKIALAAPRYHIKSTAFTINYPLKRIDEDHNVRLLIVTNAETQGMAFLREIVGRIERDQTYVDFAGMLKPTIPERWTNREIIITRDNMALKDPTISTVGVGGTILSKRADEIICDDILSPENTRTVEQRQKIKEWFYQVLLPVLAPGGRIIFVGTVWHPQDLLLEILSDASWDYRKKFSAVVSWPTHMDLWEKWYAIRFDGTQESAVAADTFYSENHDLMHEGVEVLWPEMWPFKELYLKWRSNRVSFEKSYQNNIISREDQKFKEEWLMRALERGANYRLIKAMNPDQRKEMKALTAGIDLAASEAEQSDDNAMISLGLRRLDDMVQLINIDRGKFSPNEWRKTIVEREQELKHDRILVESNAYQVALKRDLADQNIPIAAFHTGGEKFDPFIGVESLAILFENDRIILPYDKSDLDTISKVEQLVDELRAFPVGHTGDSAMAFWFAYTALRDLLQGSGQSGFLQMIEKDVATIKDKQGAPPGLPAWVQMARKQQP